MADKNMKAWIFGGAMVALLVIGWAVVMQEGSEKQLLDIQLLPNDHEVVALGRKVYQAQCAACHGVNLEGQPNWRERKPNGRLPAPPHDETGHTWHHPDAVLFALTKYGPATVVGDESYQSDMPAYEGILTDREILATLSYIKSRWPDHVRQRHDLMQPDGVRPPG
ncbi:c-type cytochrome [Kordiimonas lipolytica]|uniref:C-type cytochrome n=1 Tax=Kordiimonas lipolytica TaxID=1662421 RepID=A0ABV8U5R8_9PROT|nr:cytochrome c [Kordiimonas lipolytica]